MFYLGFIQNIDYQMLLLSNSIHNKFNDRLWWIISTQESSYILILLILWGIYRKYPLKQFCFLIILYLVLLLAVDQTSNIMKDLMERIRPCNTFVLGNITYSKGCNNSWSFFSAHAANSMALLSFSFALLRKFYKSSILLLIVPVLVGYSRIYLTVHYASDVIFGFIVGLIWSLIFYQIYSWFIADK